MDRTDINDSGKRYNPVAIENKWQQCWKEDGIYEFEENSREPHKTSSYKLVHKLSFFSNYSDTTKFSF